MLPLELQGQANAAEQAEHFLERVELGPGWRITRGRCPAESSSVWR